jgi:hypothetical protein
VAGPPLIESVSSLLRVQAARHRIAASDVRRAPACSTGLSGRAQQEQAQMVLWD